jgi:ribosomal protein S18 acetylase RimI-like enzyme
MPDITIRGVRRITRPAVLGDTGPAAALLSRAFADDPLMAWVIPDERVRRRRLPGLFAAQLGNAHLGGFYETDVMCAGGPILGCALWSPPGASPSVLQQLVAVATVPVIPMSRLVMALSTFQEINRARPKEPPHWYLSLLGVDPPAQRTGVGRGLLTPRLAQCDEARVPSALTSGEANVAYYEAFGYTATRKIEVSGNGPTHWVMWRDPGGETRVRRGTD